MTTKEITRRAIEWRENNLAPTDIWTEERIADFVESLGASGGAAQPTDWSRAAAKAIRTEVLNHWNGAHIIPAEFVIEAIILQHALPSPGESAPAPQAQPVLSLDRCVEISKEVAEKHSTCSRQCLATSVAVAVWDAQDDASATPPAASGGAAQPDKFKKAIEAALQCANGRWCEWGSRAESVQDILTSALMSCREFHTAVVNACVARNGEQNREFWDKQCSYEEEWAAGKTPDEVAQEQILSL